MEVRAAIAERYGPRAYLPTEVPDSALKEIFEAGRSAHSCFNEQPWRFLFAKKNSGDPRKVVEALLDPGNAYAKGAWILGVSFGKKTFTKTGKPNRHNGHDTGSAAQLMSLRAFDMGINMRFMAGFNAKEAAKLVPDDFEPYAMFVIGYMDPSGEHPARDRKPISDFYFENQFGKSWQPR